MEEEINNKVCWNITTKCNQNCEFCHRFLDVEELNYAENKKVLQKMIEDGITDITWTGGEALLYPKIDKLMKIAKTNGIRNKLITNGIVLAKSSDKKREKILDNIDSIALSLDSTDAELNAEMGRGAQHLENVKKVLEALQGRDIEVNVNTVISKKNIDKISDVGEFINNYDIDTWKLLKFMPFRETSVENKEKYEITEEQFEEAIESVKEKEDFSNIKNISYKQEEQMEERVLIIENGDVIMTEQDKNGNSIDVKKGNAKIDNVIKIIEESYGQEINNNNGFRDGLKVDVEETIPTEKQNEETEITKNTPSIDEK